MFAKLKSMWLEAEYADAARFLSMWRLTTTESGDIRVEPLSESLSFDDVRDVVERLERIASDSRARFIFDMSAVKNISGPWTAVFALFIDFARRCGRRCHLTALTGRLEAMAQLALRGAQLSDAHRESRGS